MTADRSTGSGIGRNGWRALIVAAAALSVAVGWRNYFVYRAAGRVVPLWETIAGELPVWYGWVALAPVIVLLARRFPPLGQHGLRNGAVHVVAAFALTGIVTIASVLFRTVLSNTPTPGNLGIPFWTFTWQVYRNISFGFLFVYASIMGLALTWVYYFEQQQRRIRESRLEALLARTERDLLRMQIHPHFLFNTMHAISALMSTDVAAARRMMTRLSDLLRLTLDESAGHEVTLEEELAFLSRYLDIQLIRFRDRLRVEYCIDEAASRLLLPRLILQPIVENALVHGLSRLERGGTVRIVARVEGSDLIVSVEDDGEGLSPQLREGLGIGNSRARLHHLYGDSATLTLSSRAETGAATRLVLPAHTQPVTETDPWMPRSASEHSAA